MSRKWTKEEAEEVKRQLNSPSGYCEMLHISTEKTEGEKNGLTLLYSHELGETVYKAAEVDKFLSLVTDLMEHNREFTKGIIKEMKSHIEEIKSNY